MINPLKKLSSIKLTRKEFLVYMGRIIIGIVGITSLLRLLSEINPRSKGLRGNQPTSFGGGAYGV